MKIYVFSSSESKHVCYTNIYLYVRTLTQEYIEDFGNMEKVQKFENCLLRFLLYVSELYSGLTRKYHLYGTRPVDIPAPQFMIFYNGIAEQPDQKILRLSDLYTVKENAPALELKALMFNINAGHNQEILGACQTLKDYAEYTSRIRMYRNEASLRYP